MVSKGRAPNTLDNYRHASHELLAVGERALAQGELVQASEKFWGAATQMIKAISEQRSWPHQGHHHLSQTVARLARETADPELHDMFTEASALHTNFYEDWLSDETVARGGQRVAELIRRLEALL